MFTFLSISINKSMCSKRNLLLTVLTLALISIGIVYVILDTFSIVSIFTVK